MPTMKSGTHQTAVLIARKRAANTPRRMFMGGLIAYQSDAHQHHPYRQRGAVHTILLKRLLAFAVVLGLAISTLAGCSTIGFYRQAVVGQFRLLNAREDVSQLLAQPDLSPELRAALADSQKIVKFAEDRLGLSADGRYSDYVTLKGKYVVWNLVITPVDSIAPRTWCFPVAGCVSYRGYFDKAQAEYNARRFDAEAYDTFVGGVPAYSTLGWFDDPLLSSFIHWPQPARAELLFHELAHGRLYVAGDTPFNESFATFVAEHALPLYLDVDAGSSALQAHRVGKRERARFNSLLLALRTTLGSDFATLKAQDHAEGAAWQQRRKAQVAQIRKTRFEQAATCFARVEHEFTDSRWARYFDSPPNLARLSLVGAYHGWVGAFERLFEEEGRDLEQFFQAAEMLSTRSADERNRELERLSAAHSESQQQIQADGDNRDAQHIECEAFANHLADGDVAG